MKKVTPNGQHIKGLRIAMDRLSTQKEFAHAIGVSERKLRAIENANSTIGIDVLERLAKVLGVHREEVAFSLNAPKLVSTDSTLSTSLASIWNDEKLIPRFDEDIARTTMDEGQLFKEAVEANDIAFTIETPLTPETSEYVDALISILQPLPKGVRGYADIDPREQISIRKTIRQNLVLLKGNDVWVYSTSVMRTLPESYSLPEEDAPYTIEFRAVVAFGPPGEYGEDSIRLVVDRGQPYLLNRKAEG
jgi:transcriptional regulator with XRE-family HTH domain